MLTLLIASVICKTLDLSTLAVGLGAAGALVTFLNRDLILFGQSHTVNHFLLPMVDMLNSVGGTPEDISFNVWQKQVEVPYPMPLNTQLHLMFDA